MMVSISACSGDSRLRLSFQMLPMAEETRSCVMVWEEFAMMAAAAGRSSG